MKKLRAAVVGCGNISSSHFKALENCSNAVLSAVCDIVHEKANKAADIYGVKAYYDIEELLKDGAADVIHICTPHYLHASQSIASLKHGCHVFCEKPMAIKYEDALAVEKAVKETGRYYGVCFQNRYNYSTKKIKEILDSSELGKIKGIKAVVAWDRDEEYYQSGDWRGKIATEGGGVMINQAIHTLDLVNLFAQSEVSSLKADISTKRLYDFVETEDTADVLITYKNGIRTVFYATLCYSGNAPVEIEINCANGRIILADKLTVRADGREDMVFDFNRAVGAKAYWGTGHNYIINDFYDCIINNGYFSVNAEEAKKSSLLIDMIYGDAR